MEIFAIILGSSVLGYVISKNIFNRETERIAHAERKKVELFLESHILVVEERNGLIQALEERRKILKDETDSLREKIIILEQQLVGARKEVEELSKEKENKYLDKIELCLKEHSRETLERYVTPLQEKISILGDNIEGNNKKRQDLLKDEINKVISSHEDLHRKIIEQIEVSSGNIQEHTTECVKIARPPRHIICGSMT